MSPVETLVLPGDPNDPITTLTELRTHEPLDDAVKYPDALIVEARDAVVAALEDACRTAFTRRTRTEQFADSIPMGAVALERGGGLNRHPAPLIIAVTVNGEPIPDGLGGPTYADSFSVARGGRLVRAGGAFGSRATITYEHGYETCPGRVRRGVRLLTAQWLTAELTSSVPDRATSMTAGDTTYRLVTAGVQGALFDLPEANALVMQYQE